MLKKSNYAPPIVKTVVSQSPEDIVTASPVGTDGFKNDGLGDNFVVD